MQTQPVKEVLVLDDCSTDDSLEAIGLVAADWNRQVRLLRNERNSGSVFRQWRKAAENATGEFLWIAEADDLSAPEFLRQMISQMRHDPSVQFAFCDSSTIDADGSPVWQSYKDYYETVAPGALARTETFHAGSFVTRFLSVKNLILNASAVVWRRNALLSAIRACEHDLDNFKVAGDWRLYLQALSVRGAEVAFCAATLNTHRRHAKSVTHALNAEKHIAEITKCQAFVRSTFNIGQRYENAQTAYLTEVSAQLRRTTISATVPAAPAKQKRALRKRASSAI